MISNTYKKKCLICEHNVNSFIEFGEMPIANSFSKSINDNEYLFSMNMGFCENCKMVQLLEQPERERMFHNNYAFFSSTSEYMKKHFYNFFLDLKKKQKLNQKSLVIEIGCNYGIFLENFTNEKIPCIGIEPSKNVAQVSRQKGINVIDGFFDQAMAKNIIDEHGKADIIMSANVMCHIPYINSVFEGISLLLKKDGVFIFEDPYLGDVVKKNSFDQIYDEHVFLFSALSIKHLANKHKLELVNVEHQITHGGSMRYTLALKNNTKVNSNVLNLLAEETSLGLDKSLFYLDFEKNINQIKIELIQLLKKLKKEGKKVVGYGATSKSTTVINYFNISRDLIDCIFDTTPTKFYTFSPGKHIPVMPYSEFKKSNPDYVLLFAWNHANEIMQKEKDYMKNKHWILYVPKVDIF